MQIVDLFCGMGGFSTGATRAGYTVILAIDNWDTALTVHKKNHPEAVHINMELGGDLMTIIEIIRSNLKPGPWHLHGSPPCQNVSIANKTGDKSEGMRLVNWYLELVNRIRPTSWSMEQVPAISKLLTVDHVILDASDYGAPQTRKRLYAGSILEKVGESKKKVCESKKKVALIDVLPNLEGQWIRGYSGTRSIRIDGKHVSNRPLSGIEGYRSVNRPTYTLCAKGPLKLHDENFGYIRQLTLQECLIIQTFPIDYDISGISKRDAYRMIGNAVPPLMACMLISGK